MPRDGQTEVSPGRPKKSFHFCRPPTAVPVDRATWASAAASAVKPVTSSFPSPSKSPARGSSAPGENAVRTLRAGAKELPGGQGRVDGGFGVLGEGDDVVLAVAGQSVGEPPSMTPPAS
jgi:hypothetical protein